VADPVNTAPSATPSAPPALSAAEDEGPPLEPRAYLINTLLLLALMLVLGLIARTQQPFNHSQLFTWGSWPVLVICGGMIAAAILDWWLFKVPNKLTFPLILTGWALGLLHSIDSWFNLNLHFDAGTGGIGASLLGTLWGFALLLLVLAVGGVGQGDVKMTMGFGAWVGAFYGIHDGAPGPLGGHALAIIWWAFAAGVIIGGIMGFIMILIRGDYRRNLAHTREILTDMLRPTQAAKRAQERRPRWHRLPYGVPLCVGFLGYLYYIYSQVSPG
jgi:prepilin peptidase CpaA